jgi:hypothetical protein
MIKTDRIDDSGIPGQSTRDGVSRYLATVFIAMTSVVCLSSIAARADDISASISASTDWREDYAYIVGMQAYIYGYPALRYTRDRYYMVEKPKGIVQIKVNDFFHVSRLADSNDKYSNSPNHDTIYSLSWIDLTDEPVVLHAPQGDGRYIDIELADFYSDVFGYVSPHMHDGKAITYLLVGPDWDAPVPEGQFDGVLRAPTPWVWTVARVYTSGGDDLVTARGIQSQFGLAPLSQWTSGKFIPSTRVDVLDPFPVTDDPLADFRTMNAAMRENPPPARDAALMREFARVGLGPEADVSLDDLDEHTRRGLRRALLDGDRLLDKLADAGGDTKVVNNWFFGDKNWGRMAERGDFLGRASPQAYAGGIEHWVEMAAKLRTFADADGQTLNGSNRYVLRFQKNQVPTARAFWSITVYDDKFNLAENVFNKYLVSSASRDLVYGKDGSLEIYLQADQPEQAKRANWIPLPEGDFNLFFRFYLPDRSMIDQSYVPPPVQRLVAD